MNASFQSPRIKPRAGVTRLQTDQLTRCGRVADSTAWYGYPGMAYQFRPLRFPVTGSSILCHHDFISRVRATNRVILYVIVPELVRRSVVLPSPGYLCPLFCIVPTWPGTDVLACYDT